MDIFWQVRLIENILSKSDRFLQQVRLTWRITLNQLREISTRAYVYSIIVQFICPEAVAQACSVKNVSLKILQNSQENTCTRVTILINFVFLRILQNFSEHLFLQNTSDGCFWIIRNYSYSLIRLTSLWAKV